MAPHGPDAAHPYSASLTTAASHGFNSEPPYPQNDSIGAPTAAYSRHPLGQMPPGYRPASSCACSRRTTAPMAKGWDWVGIDSDTGPRWLTTLGRVFTVHTHISGLA